MKVPPKRKGNAAIMDTAHPGVAALNESPSEKEGKLGRDLVSRNSAGSPSMKVPPKRKGNRKHLKTRTVWAHSPQ